MAQAATDEEEVKVEQLANEPMSTTTKMAHALAIAVGAVIALAVSAVLADGTSVIRLKDPSQLPIATNPAYKSVGIHHRLDELLGPTYGVGLHHDQSGHSWTAAGAGNMLKELEANLGIPTIAAALPYVISTDDLKHPVPFLMCRHLMWAGVSAMSLGFIAEAAAVVMIIFHTLALAGLMPLPSKFVKPLAALVWFVLTAGFLVVVLLGIGIYTSPWDCENTIIPRITLSDHFDYNYGFYFAVIGFVSALLVLLAFVIDHSKPSCTCAVPRLVCGFTVGLAVCGILSLIVLGGVGALEPEKPKLVPPTYNKCDKQKPYHAGPNDHFFSNIDCAKNGVVQALEQAGANVTKGYKGKLDAGDREPITTSYAEAGLCPVNVHWHLGAEHLSVGQYDEHGKGPAEHHRRQLAAGKKVRLGHQCHHYDKDDEKFTKPFTWHHCTDMEVGQTYEIHWPHSAAGACGTVDQYQTPFYDGVFCNDGVITLAPLNTYKKIGVQSQVFTVVNDEAYYYGDLIKGWIQNKGQGKGQDLAKYTGSTTGTSRDNKMCSRYAPITWQVDRKCHMISASSFDKLCADMKAQKDDMSGDFHPHGAREVVADHLTADNQYDARKRA